LSGATVRTGETLGTLDVIPPPFLPGPPGGGGAPRAEDDAAPAPLDDSGGGAVVSCAEGRDLAGGQLATASGRSLAAQWGEGGVWDGLVTLFGCGNIIWYDMKHDMIMFTLLKMGGGLPRQGWSTTAAAEVKQVPMGQGASPMGLDPRQGLFVGWQADIARVLLLVGKMIF